MVRRPDLPLADSGGHTSDRPSGGHTSRCFPKPAGHGRSAGDLSLLSRLCFRGRPVAVGEKQVPDPRSGACTARRAAVQPGQAEHALHGRAGLTLQCRALPDRDAGTPGRRGNPPRRPGASRIARAYLLGRRSRSRARLRLPASHPWASRPTGDGDRRRRPGLYPLDRHLAPRESSRSPRCPVGCLVGTLSGERAWSAGRISPVPSEGLLPGPGKVPRSLRLLALPLFEPGLIGLSSPHPLPHSPRLWMPYRGPVALATQRGVCRDPVDGKSPSYHLPLSNLGPCCRVSQVRWGSPRRSPSLPPYRLGLSRSVCPSSGCRA